VGIMSKYARPERTPAPQSDSTTRLAEALLGSEMHKSARALVIRFDQASDSTIVHSALVGLRDSYRPPRK
jgi:hypothetical protein